VSEHGNNATPPSPAIAPGAEAIDTFAVARELASRGMDPRLTRAIPAFDAPFFQAGLAGYSDAAMRVIARRHGAPLAITEALLDRMLLAGGHGFDKADLELLADALPCSHEDQPLVGQIIGSDPGEMAAAALKMVEQSAQGDKHYRALAYPDGRFPTSTDPRWRPAPTNDTTSDTAADGACEDDCTPESLLELANEQPPEAYDPRSVIAPVARAAHSVARAAQPANPPASALRYAAIDVNLACPVKKIDRKSRGGHWLREPEGALAILKEVRRALPAHIVCTVKLRRAYDDTPEMARNFERIFNASYELGYAFATVHARTVEQKYLGPSRWTFLKDLCARHPDKPVLGSGDIWDVHDIFRMIAYTGVSAVSVARGCIGNPWIFRQARDMLAGRPPSPPTLAQQRDVLLEHFRLAVALSGEQHGSRLMRKFGIKFARHHPRGEDVKLAFARVADTHAWQTALHTHYPA
jgi:tRNA-dihydrouridine synthase